MPPKILKSEGLTLADGLRLLHAKDRNGDNLLCYALKNNSSIEIVSMLVQTGGQVLVLDKTKYEWRVNNKRYFKS